MDKNGGLKKQQEALFLYRSTNEIVHKRDMYKVWAVWISTGGNAGDMAAGAAC